MGVAVKLCLAIVIILALFSLHHVFLYIYIIRLAMAIKNNNRAVYVCFVWLLVFTVLLQTSDGHGSKMHSTMVPTPRTQHPLLWVLPTGLTSYISLQKTTTLETWWCSMIPSLWTIIFTPPLWEELRDSISMT